MKKKVDATSYNNLMAIGFGLFFAGIFFTTILQNHVAFQVIGIVLLFGAAGVFGASIRINGRKKRQ